MTSKHIVLIDFENVTPTSLDGLKEVPLLVLVFVGAKQTKIPFELAFALQGMGHAGRYVKISGSSKDALDFHIAFYIGELSVAHPNARFFIVSKDGGFDPLIEHLAERKIDVRRVVDLKHIGKPTPLAEDIDDEALVQALVERLQCSVKSRPRTIATLSNWVRSTIRTLSVSDTARLLRRLKTEGYIRVNENNIVYQLPSADDNSDAPF
ncbi:PIN domain-containing protein [Roseiconus lacunae]|uniref:PIN domain-containing protein n=1 Tax=Roseiconus lacunae TaxID=2605694 RepID=A0ABT7PEH7_9BACT|nr:PIN domain-containing protein [Roseiconus lacunae]MCD0462068.1 PIN domain-containing protein [Roseiconus lacunae]MDM4014908.1 PIN domain-containing protein [Roseiconus lacunae]WRQ50488.1 PIN domain-containing protein [Stieleria sp. HD01]